ncbi:MAG: amidohydrolase [Clostridia bacterium]|nr:amidohydrolase [Clostridia bacterium]
MELDVVNLRREFHMIPEVGFKEFQTSKLICSILTNNNIQYQSGIAGTGVIVKFGEGHPHIAFRTEIDALPIQELNEVSYKSKINGFMHACGHDCHIAALIDTVIKVKALFDEKIIKKGAVSFIFQPSEEAKNDSGFSGGQIISELPALQDVDNFFAAHVESTLDFGKIFIRGGALTAAIDRFDISIIGKAGHGAYPHNAVDPIWLSSNVMQAINSLKSRTVNTANPSVISICSINGGTSWNSIPNEVALTGTIRTFNQNDREKIHKDIGSCLQIAKALGGNYQLKISQGHPSVINSDEECEVVRSAVKKVLGDSAISIIDFQMGGDDFSYYATKKPSCYFYVGAKKDQISRQHHSGNFDINEKAIENIVNIFIEIIKEKLL